MMLYWAMCTTVVAIILLVLLIGSVASEKEYKLSYEQALWRADSAERKANRSDDSFNRGFREGQDSVTWRYVGLEESYNSAKIRANNWQDECLRLRQAIDALWGVGEGGDCG